MKKQDYSNFASWPPPPVDFIHNRTRRRSCSSGCSRAAAAHGAATTIGYSSESLGSCHRQQSVASLAAQSTNYEDSEAEQQGMSSTPKMIKQQSWSKRRRRSKIGGYYSKSSRLRSHSKEDYSRSSRLRSHSKEDYSISGRLRSHSLEEQVASCISTMQHQQQDQEPAESTERNSQSSTYGFLMSSKAVVVEEVHPQQQTQPLHTQPRRRQNQQRSLPHPLLQPPCDFNPRRSGFFLLSSVVESWRPSTLFILFALCHNLLRLLAKIILSMMLKGRRLWALLLVLAFYAQFAMGVEGASGKGGFRCKEPRTTTACLPKEYSKFDLPLKGSQNKIKVTIDISEVLRINDKDYSITFACYFNVQWEENRIWLSEEFGREQAGAGVNTTMNPDITVPMNLEFVKDLWLPNIFIYNLKTYKVIDVLSKLAGLWISADKIILYSQATHITFICPMRFDKFPLDTQVCKFQVGSYSYDDTIMRFTTEKAGYNSPTGNSIALDYAIRIDALKKEDAIFLGGTLGNFSLAGFEMTLHRYVSTYIITYYLPSGLFVIVSWISFLIPMDVIPGRMALLVTLFLVLVNIFNTVTTNTPKAEGLTAIEAWMLACILFVFGALIE